mgnify:CR=1 FL=1
MDRVGRKFVYVWTKGSFNRINSDISGKATFAVSESQVKTKGCNCAAHKKLSFS